jgi:5-methylcytosine-specific restriction endonuclease McrA/endogenous inhibitor of DNA gyrase (YacG/DUF329 family)
MDDDRRCPGCARQIVPNPRERNPKRWCSERCRYWASKYPGTLRPIARSCPTCGADMSERSTRAIYCTTRCGEVARGQRLPQSLPLRKCDLPECGLEFQPKREGGRCCSEKHGKLLWNRESRAEGRQKPPPWSDARRDRYHRRRAQKREASTGEPVLMASIAERDGWRCSLCSLPVDPAVAWPNSLSPSLDHRVPLSRGGAHDPSNVFLAHLGCNSSKGDRMPEDGPLLTG